MTLKKKIVLIGQSGVGKTSLVNQFVNESFSDNYLTTVGVSIKKKNLRLNDQNISLIIWDIAGDLSAGTTYDNYIKGAAGILLVADGTNSSSIDYAISKERANHPSISDIPKILIMNKSDLEEEWKADLHEISDIKTFKTSAKTNHNVEKAFEAISTLIIADTNKFLWIQIIK